MVAGMDKENLESSSARGSLEEERQTAEHPQLEVQRTIQEHRRATESYQPSEDANSPERSARYPIGDLLKDFTLALTKDKRSILPPGFMPQLENQMERVISGKEMLDGYSDVFIRRSFAEAYTTFTERAFRRQIDKDRRADDLILIFCSHATEALQRDNAPHFSSLELLVDRHVAMFVKVICSTLIGCGNDNLRELMEQLMTLESKLLANDQFRLLTNDQEKFAGSGKGVGVSRIPSSADGSSGSTLTPRHPKAKISCLYISNDATLVAPPLTGKSHKLIFQSSRRMSTNQQIRHYFLQRIRPRELGKTN
jgi:hypothetical protein